MKKIFILGLTSLLAVSCGVETKDTVEQSKENTVVSEKISQESDYLFMDNISEEQREDIVSMFPKTIEILKEKQVLTNDTEDFETKVIALEEQYIDTFLTELTQVEEKYPKLFIKDRNFTNNTIAEIVSLLHDKQEPIESSDENFITMLEKSEIERKDIVKIHHLDFLKKQLYLYYEKNGNYPDNINQIDTIDKNKLELLVLDLYDTPSSTNCNSSLGYQVFTYKGIEKGAYIIDICLASQKYLDKAKNDGGNDDMRYEIGSDL